MFASYCLQPTVRTPQRHLYQNLAQQSTIIWFITRVCPDATTLLPNSSFIAHQPLFSLPLRTHAHVLAVCATPAQISVQMPILLLPDGTSLPESEVIAQYLLDKCGGGMQAPTPELRAVAALAARLHDQYITPIQVCCCVVLLPSGHWHAARCSRHAAGTHAPAIGQLDVVAKPSMQSPHLASWLPKSSCNIA